MPSLNIVFTTVNISGKDCHFVHLTLHQTFNSHHTFVLKIDYSELDTKWMANPIKIIQLIGEDVVITMQHKHSDETNLFKGIITNVEMSGEHGEQNYIIIYGCSPTIRLDGMPTMDSFVDLTLDNIVQQSIENSGNGADVAISPVFKGKIDYITQYNETCFQFLNRLSWLYGEWFGYDGTTIFFGKPDLKDAVTLTYDVEMTHFNFSANLIPSKLNRFDYLTHDVNEVSADIPDRVDGVRGYIKASLDQSNKVYTSDATRPLEASILTRKDLDDLVKVDKYRSISRMLTMKGRTQTCKVRIGRLINVQLPSNMEVDLKHVETFLVTQVTHEADQDGTYYNSFTAIPSEMENIPMIPIKEPIALPEIAWVKSNADNRGRGRVKVEFQWQKKLNKTTNWIRVATPDAGSSNNVASNRGFVFIPEEGDLVMINFEKGDPNRPYVSASIFAENMSQGGGQSNKSKSITTRSGSTVTLDDNQGKGSISIKEPSGNTIVMDGNENISIVAPNSQDINVGGGQSHLNMDAGGNIVLEANTNITLKVGSNEIVIDGSGININVGSGNLSINSSGEFSANSGGEMTINTSSDLSITSGASAVISSGDTCVM